MTAVEFLIEQLQAPCRGIPSHIIEKAKEMEKQQIIDAAERWKGTDFAEQYYNETYGSKGSDENFKQFSLYEHKETIATADTPTSSQIEISDEEIKKYVKRNNPYPSTKQGSIDWEHGFITAIEWYREQLKSNI